jgi:hypothetical protein
MHLEQNGPPGIQGCHDEVRAMQTGPKKRQTKRSLTRSFVVTVAVGIPGALAIATGCGASTPENNNAGPGTAPQGPGVQTGKCDNEGEQRPCHFSVGKAGQVQSCFSGTQTCTAGLWGACGGDGIVTSTVVGSGLNLAPSTPSQGGLHIQAGINVSCGDGTCSAKKCMGGADNGKSCNAPADCAGAKPCVAAETCTSCPTDCGVCPPGAPDGGVAVCTTDPCNPDCQGWTNAPGISSAGGGGGSSVIGVSGFGQIPAGQLKKLLNDSCNGGAACDNFGAIGVPSSYYNCQVDTTCSVQALGGDGCCHQFAAPGGVQGTDPTNLGVNAGIDITMGPGCSDTESDKYRYFPICNRGALPVPAGTIIKVKYFTPVQPFSPCQNTSCVAANSFDCSMKVGDAVAKNGSTATAGLDLLPGTCQLLDTQQAGMGPGGAACSQPSGEKWMYANCDGAVVEGDITMKPGAPPVGVTGAPTNEPITAPGISGCANNWSDHAGTNNPPSCNVQGQNVVTVSSDYHAICPVGTAPVWSKLVYDTTNQSNMSGTSEVFFEAATAPDVAGVPGVFSSFIELAEATDNSFATTRDPTKCSATQPAAPPYSWTGCTNATIGPAPPCCPKDIEDQFVRSIAATPFPGADPVPGKVLARQEWLRLQITIKATPDNKKDAVLNSWGLSYQCIARE